MLQYILIKKKQNKKNPKKAKTKSFVTCNTGGHETRDAASHQSSDATPGDIGLSTWSKVCWKKTTSGSQSWIDSYKEQAKKKPSFFFIELERYTHSCIQTRCPWKQSWKIRTTRRLQSFQSEPPKRNDDN